VDTRPLTKFEGGLNQLHEADDDAVMWLKSTVTAALAIKYWCDLQHIKEKRLPVVWYKYFD